MDQDPIRDALRIALGRQYEVSHLLGRGGMGAVYLAHETALERDVAIKVLQTGHAASQKERERFRREARTAARLSHPNIVPLHTFAEVDETSFFVMGYVRGESLSSRIKRLGRLDQEEARKILIEISEALEYAHKLGIVHRDIKPDNVLIDDETGRAMLTDFGVSKVVGAGETMTAEGSLIGTPHYMSPEQAEGKREIDHRSDLYSLGVMAYVMLSGRLPFDGQTVGDQLVQRITRDAPPLKDVARDVDDDLASAVMRCLSREPQARWETAGALRAAITDDGEAPPALEGLNRLAYMAIACLIAVGWFALWWFGGGDRTNYALPVVAGVTVAFMAFTFLLVLAAKSIDARRSGFDSARILREILRQPAWWIGPYPRRFRVRGDVWDRLPPHLKRARTSMLLWIVASLLMLVPAFILTELHVRMAVTVTLLGLCAATFVYALIAMGQWERWARRTGLSDPHLRAHMTGAPASKRSFWSKPEVARLLVTPASTRLVGDSPSAVASGLESLARSAEGATRELALRAASLGRGLVSAIVALETDIALLRSAMEPGEVQRLAAKLEALPPSGADDVRLMLKKQLDIAQDVERRLEDASARRRKRLELLHDLWEEATQHDRAGADVRVAALCDRIAAEIGSDTTQVSADIPTIKR